MPRILAVLSTMFVFASCGSGTSYPGPVEGECAITDGVVMFRSLITSSYEAADGSSATTRSYWDVLCSIPRRSCDGTVTVVGSSGGIAAGRKANIRDGSLTHVDSNTARMKWDGAILFVNVWKGTVHYGAFPNALIQGEGNGACRPVDD